MDLNLKYFPIKLLLAVETNFQRLTLKIIYKLHLKVPELVFFVVETNCLLQKLHYRSIDVNNALYMVSVRMETLLKIAASLKCRKVATVECLTC